MKIAAETVKPNDYKTTLTPVWCPGCGHFGVLSALYRAMAELRLETHNTAVLSGIGCSSRLPGYVNCYGFNGVHGRALTLATGVKVARPDLTVIAVGGDGDGLAIGGNHFLHAARRNVDITYIMMDNEIYALTKGQVAPTTPTGDKTKSTPWGNPEPAVDPCEMAISVGATWVGRGFSGDPKSLSALIVLAVKHHGFSFLNVISPCVTFRGDNQMKKLREMVRTLPEEHDRTDRRRSVKYTRETGVLTTGVLYEVEQRSLEDHLASFRKIARGDRKEPTVSEILETFYPNC